MFDTPNVPIVKPQSMAIPYAGDLMRQGAKQSPFTGLAPTAQPATADAASMKAQQAHQQNAMATAPGLPGVGKMAGCGAPTIWQLLFAKRPLPTTKSAFTTPLATLLSEDLGGTRRTKVKTAQRVEVRRLPRLTGEEKGSGGGSHASPKPSYRGGTQKLAQISPWLAAMIGSVPTVSALTGAGIGGMQADPGQTMQGMQQGFGRGLGTGMGMQLGGLAGAGVGNLFGGQVPTALGAAGGAALGGMTGYGVADSLMGQPDDQVAPNPAMADEMVDEANFEHEVMAGDRFQKRFLEKAAHPAVHRYLRDTLMNHAQPDPVGAAYADWTYANYTAPDSAKTASLRRRYELLAHASVKRAASPLDNKDNGGYTVERGERCCHCNALFEEGEGGICNSCNKPFHKRAGERHPAHAATDAAIEKIAASLDAEQARLLRKGHGRKKYACGCMQNCRCSRGHGLPVLEIKHACYDCTEKQAAQDNAGPQRSATGESNGLSFGYNPGDYAQGQDAWASVSKYFKTPLQGKTPPNPYIGKHAGLKGALDTSYVPSGVRVDPTSRDHARGRVTPGRFRRAKGTAFTGPPDASDTGAGATKIAQRLAKRAVSLLPEAMRQGMMGGGPAPAPGQDLGQPIQYPDAGVPMAPSQSGTVPAGDPAAAAMMASPAKMAAEKQAFLGKALKGLGRAVGEWAPAGALGYGTYAASREGGLSPTTSGILAAAGGSLALPGPWKRYWAGNKGLGFSDRIGETLNTGLKKQLLGAKLPIAAGALGYEGIQRGLPILENIQQTTGEAARGSTALANLAEDITTGGKPYTGVDPATGQSYDLTRDLYDRYRRLNPAAKSTPRGPAISDDVLKRLQLKQNPSLGETVSKGVSNITANAEQAAKGLSETTQATRDAAKDIGGAAAQIGNSADRATSAVEGLNASAGSGLKNLGDAAQRAVSGVGQFASDYGKPIAYGVGGAAGIYALYKVIQKLTAKKKKPARPAYRRRPQPKVTLRNPGSYMINFPDDDPKDEAA